MRRWRRMKGLREMEASISPGMVAFEGFRFDVDLRRSVTSGRHGGLGAGRGRCARARCPRRSAATTRRLVTKDAIMRQVWPGTAVEANNLTVQITALRKVLDGGRPSESCIQTVAGRGYRFVAFITRPSDESPNFPEQLSGHSKWPERVSHRRCRQISISRNRLGRSRRARPRRSSLRRHHANRGTPTATGRAEVEKAARGNE